MKVKMAIEEETIVAIEFNILMKWYHFTQIVWWYYI